MFKKDIFIKIVICEHWYSLKSWKGSAWDEKKKLIWISGMHRAYNLLNPDTPIDPLEIHRMIKSWSLKEATKWYSEFKNPKDDKIGSRFEILDMGD